MQPNLVSIFDALINEMDGMKKIKFGRLLGVWGNRGLVAILIFPILLTILPSGMVPFFPAAMALMMIFIAAHMLIGKSEIWLPKALYHYELPTSALGGALKRMKRKALMVDQWTVGRFSWVLKLPLMDQFIAAIVITYSVIIIVFGFVPGVPALLCAALLPLVIGVASRNGLVLLVGVIGNLLVVFLVLQLLP